MTSAVLATALGAFCAAVPAQADEDPRAALPAVTPEAETPAVFDDEEGGNADADDPAIWRDPADPERSLVVATAKEGGLRVYDLEARQVQSIPAPPPPGPGDAPGRFNNVDIVEDVRLGEEVADLAVVSDRGRDRLRVYRIDPRAPEGPLVDVTATGVPAIFTDSQQEINEEMTAYGLTTWTDRRTDRSYALVSRSGRTRITLLELTSTPEGTVDYREVRSLRLPSTFRLPDGSFWSPCADPGELPQVEGMVVDPANGMLYAAQETVGVWRVRADLTSGPKLVDRVREFGVPATYDAETDECVPGEDPGFGGRHLAADVEGLTLLTESDGDGYVLASSQGDSTFVLYDRELEDRNEHEGGFRVTAASPTLDGTQETDGVAVLNAALGDSYPDGLLVVHDGDETPSEPAREATNLKFVDLGELMDELDD
ncbi:phytase [Actinopolyspora mortivallis]|uniref:Hydrolase n=1 Tax=Actinopolyspora mortivallis TaxID=33906 RepID=A0A2T0GXI8_ACTMO|nr:hydrolase [Actinopolyspora mortivallis]